MSGGYQSDYKKGAEQQLSLQIFHDTFGNPYLLIMLCPINDLFLFGQVFFPLISRAVYRHDWKRAWKIALDFLYCLFHSCKQLTLQNTDLGMKANKTTGISETTQCLILLRQPRLHQNTILMNSISCQQQSIHFLTIWSMVIININIRNLKCIRIEQHQFCIPSISPIFETCQQQQKKNQ